MTSVSTFVSGTKSASSVTRDHLPVVEGDATQLGQLFQNLIANGIKFHRPGEAPRLHVSATRERGAWIFSVVDNGKGFDLATTPKSSGLQNMRDRMDALGGTLEVRSAPGSGTMYPKLSAVPANRNPVT